MTTNPLRLKLVLVLLLILFNLLFGILLCCLLCKSTSVAPGVEMYEIIEITPSRNKSLFSRIETSEIDVLETDHPFLSFSNPNEGIYTFVKPVGGNRYSCEGTCYCNSLASSSDTYEPSRRLALSPTLISRFTILLSAFSVFMAQEMSERVFEEECERSQDTITDICDPRTFKIKTLCSEEPDVSNKDAIREFPEIHRYECTGTCKTYGRNVLPTDNILTRYSRELGEYWNENDCSKLRMNKIEHLYTFQFHYPFCGDDLNWFQTEKPSKEEYFRRAESCVTFKFVLYHFDKFCKEKSMIVNGNENVYGCDSGTAHWEGPFLFEVEREKMENPSIKCDLIGTNPELVPF